jgi:hypothetical protein
MMELVEHLLLISAGVAFVVTVLWWKKRAGESVLLTPGPIEDDQSVAAARTALLQRGAGEALVEIQQLYCWTTSPELAPLDLLAPCKHAVLSDRRLFLYPDDDSEHAERAVDLNMLTHIELRGRGRHGRYRLAEGSVVAELHSREERFFVVAEERFLARLAEASREAKQRFEAEVGAKVY